MATSSVLQHDLSTSARVIAVFENPNFLWHTLSGLVRETQLPRGDVLETLSSIPEDNLVTSRGAKAETLYTARRHYRQRQSLAGKLLTVLAGRAL